MADTLDVDALQCPLTHDLMDDPVIAEDGHTYERSAITCWILKNGTSPFTRQQLKVDQLRPNRAIKRLIERYRPQPQQQQQTRLPEQREPIPTTTAKESVLNESGNNIPIANAKTQAHTLRQRRDQTTHYSFDDSYVYSPKDVDEIPSSAFQFHRSPTDHRCNSSFQNDNEDNGNGEYNNSSHVCPAVHHLEPYINLSMDDRLNNRDYPPCGVSVTSPPNCVAVPAVTAIAGPNVSQSTRRRRRLRIKCKSCCNMSCVGRGYICCLVAGVVFILAALAVTLFIILTGQLSSTTTSTSTTSTTSTTATTTTSITTTTAKTNSTSAACIRAGGFYSDYRNVLPLYSVILIIIT